MSIQSIFASAFTPRGTTWIDDYWQENAERTAESVDTSDFNAGQLTIWEDIATPAIEDGIALGPDFTVDGFINIVQTAIDNEDFGLYDRAFSDTVEALAYELEAVWDDAFGGDSVGIKRFLGVIYS